jgi:hypothetical protein
MGATVSVVDTKEEKEIWKEYSLSYWNINTKKFGKRVKKMMNEKNISNK